MLRRTSAFALVVVLASCDRAHVERAATSSAASPSIVDRLSRVRGLSFVGKGESPSVEGERWSVQGTRARPSIEGTLSGSKARIGASEGAWVELSRVDHGDDRGRAIGGATSFEDTTWAWSKRAVEHLHVVATNAPIVLEMQVGPAFASVDVVRDRVWLKDAHGRALLETDKAWVEDAKGTRRALHLSAAGAPPSMQLTLSFEGAGLVAPIVVDPAWTTVASMNEARVGAAGVSLADGRVLVIGGEADSTITGTYEIYDPTTNIWTEGTGAPYLRQNDVPPRFAVLLTSGKVLAGPSGMGSVASVYDPIANTWTPTPVVSPPGGTALAALPGGLGMIIGGYNPSNSSLPIATTTIVDPATNTLTAGPPMNRPRMLPAALTMPDGRILVAGDLTDATDATTEYYDPTTRAWTYGPSMTKWRSEPQLVLLTNGDVGVYGFAFDIDILSGGAWKNVAALPGSSGSSGDAITGFSGVAPLPGGQALLLEWCFLDTCAKFNAQRFDGTSLLAVDSPDVLRAAGPVVRSIAGGRVLVAGGAGLDEPLSVVEIFEPAPAAPATPCTAPGTCASLACIDGYCCASTSCGAGSTCGGPATSALGTCHLKNGQTCTAASDCGSGICVDGVCCNAACTGACEACDGAGSVGTCTPIAGAPHGTRTPCTATPTTCGLACDGINP
ncbi:MAG: Kelch repeat-containing protein, partial [Polyangiales bacterium]